MSAPSPSSLRLLTRTMDAGMINAVANHPEVRPWLGGAGRLDFSAFLSDPNNFALCNEHGGWLYHRLEPGRYEVHSMFLPEGRGAGLIEAMREGLRFMFCATDANEIVTRFSVSNKSAQGMARSAGFRELFTRDTSAPLFDEPTAYASLTLDHWRRGDPEIAGVGAWFHDELDRLKAEAGLVLDTHGDDEAHDRAVGATILMIRAGQVRKALWHYNRWGRIAGFQPMAVLSESPALFDVPVAARVRAIMSVGDQHMEVLAWREQ